MGNSNFSGLLNQAVPTGQETKKPGAGLFAELGILSPSEKRQQDMQAMLAQQQIQMMMASQQQQQQLALANAKANVPTGYNFAPFMAQGGLMNIQNAERATRANAPMGMGGPQAPNVGPTGGGISPQQVITDALAKYPDDQATAFKVAAQQLLVIGQQTGDHDLMNIASNLMRQSQEADKEQAGIAGTKAATAKTVQDTELDAAQAGNPGTPFDHYDGSGNQVTVRDKKDAQGRVVGQIEVGRGMPAQRQVTGYEPKEEYEEFRKYVTAKDEVNERIDFLIDGLKDGAAQGWVASGVNFLNNVAGTVRQLAPETGDGAGEMSGKAMATLRDMETKTFAKWAEQTGVQSSVWADIVAIMAKADNPTGNITENDVRRSAGKIGATVSDPKTVLKILKNAKEFSNKDVEGKYKYLHSSVQEMAKPQYDTYKSRWGDKPKETSKSTGNIQVISDKATYDKLPSGAKYRKPGDPEGKYRVKK